MSDQVGPLNAIFVELRAAEAKHPRWPGDLVHVAAILAEEAGEAVRAALDCVYAGGELATLRRELAQTGAMALRALLHLPDEAPVAPPPVRGSFEVLGAQVGELVDRKQAAYGDSFGRSGDVLRVLYPRGIAPEQMDDALAVVRVVDKLFRIATDRDALGESPWCDIAGYSLLGAARSGR